MSHLELSVGTVLEGRYGIVRELSRGNTNRVFEGRQTNLGLPIIIKTPTDLSTDAAQARQQVEQVLIEARILAALRHPNLLSVYDSFVFEGHPILITEFLEGRRLSEVAQLAPRQINARRVLTWTEQLLDVLGYLHAQDPPIIVRDLKPSNVLLGRDGRLRITDFSLAKRMSQQGSGTQEILKGLGTDGYAPLEQTAYSRTGPATDLYALGATLYYLLTKTTPAAASSRAVAGRDPLVDPRTVNDTITDDLWDGIQSLMALRAQERPQSVAQARELLFPTESSPVKLPGRQCVDCQVALDQWMRGGVEIDQCPDCGGIWLDRDELERLIELGGEVRAFEASGPDSDTLKLPVQDQTISLKDIEAPSTIQGGRMWQLLQGVFEQFSANPSGGTSHPKGPKKDAK